MSQVKANTNPMAQGNTTMAALTYLPIIGWGLAWGANKEDELVMFHARQSVGLYAVAILTPLIWLVFSMIILNIVYVGGVVAAATFALVMLTYFYLIIMLVIGVMNALRGKLNTLPLVDNVVERIFG